MTQGNCVVDPITGIILLMRMHTHSGVKFLYVSRIKRPLGDKDPLHLDVVDRYLRRMGDKAIPE